jgi:hypothetical protein
LAQYTRERSDFNFIMHWHYAALWPAAHDDVATVLANFDEAEMLKGFYDSCA